ncbi:MAG: hypothetical protein RL341_763 [Pseudomonadota bacterium]|jgi:hypothetical protein
MWQRVAADGLLIVHGLFILFAVFGGFLALRWRWVPWLHLPCMVWAAAVVGMGWICPLTPWEQQLRIAAGQQGYQGGFIEHYLLAAIYPDGLTRGVQVALAVSVLLINAAAYALLFKQRRRQSAGRPNIRPKG